MPDRQFPKDSIGNDIRRGHLVAFNLPSNFALAQVIDVVEAGTIVGADQKPMQLMGSVTLAIRIPYKAGIPMNMCHVLQQPEGNDQIKVVSEIPKAN